MKWSDWDLDLWRWIEKEADTQKITWEQAARQLKDQLKYNRNFEKELKERYATCNDVVNVTD